MGGKCSFAIHSQYWRNKKEKRKKKKEKINKLGENYKAVLKHLPNEITTKKLNDYYVFSELLSHASVVNFNVPPPLGRRKLDPVVVTQWKWVVTLVKLVISCSKWRLSRWNYWKPKLLNVYIPRNPSQVLSQNMCFTHGWPQQDPGLMQQMTIPTGQRYLVVSVIN